MYKFPLDYFKDEYREGFLVESMVKRAWAAQLEVLGHIVIICEKYNLKYWAMWGTLLGAIRHNGYVPWDDDFDIAMKREDYDTFLQVAKNELPEGYVVMSPYTEPEWKEQIARVNNSHSIKFTNEFLDEYHGFPYSTGIDIFPYDYVPDDDRQREEQMNLAMLVKNLRDQVIARNDRLEKGIYQNELEEEISFGLNNVENFFGFEFNRDVYLDNQLLCLFDQIAAGYGNKPCEYMTCLSERTKRQKAGAEFLVPAFLLEEIVDHEFEGIKIKVPKYYEIILSICYGKNFMIPVKSGGSAHEYPYFKRQIEVLHELGRYDEVMEAVNNSDKRLLANGIIKTENIVNCGKDIRDEVNWNKKGLKSIMYCMSTIDVINQEEKAVEKFERSLSYFEKNKDTIQLVLLIDPLVNDILKHESDMLLAKYKNIVDKYILDGWGYYTYTDKIITASEYCDAYYGSSNEYIKLFTVNKKPVMIQNIDM